MWFKNLSLRSKVLIGGLSPLVLLLIIGIVSITSIHSIVETNKWVVHTHEVIEQVTGVIGSAVDMETGMRGYLLAGKDSFLDGCRYFWTIFKIININNIIKISIAISSNI